MKIFVIACFLGLASATALSPVTRVVELLQSLSKQVEAEGKKEEGLYEDFVCWGKSIINQKTASNAASESRITELETYIADLESGRIELTSERTDLEKEIAGLMADMEEATALRKKEKEDFEQAEDEMTKALAALDSAIDTLGKATKDHKEGVLLAVRASLKGAAENGGMAALAQRQATLKQAVDLGEHFLEKADATFLKRVLLGDVPNVDWKKLNRKATFKMAYKARSFKIQGVLKKMHQTFEINLNDAKDAEAKAKDEYDKLTNGKQDQLDAARDALNKMESEGGAAGLSKQEAIDERDSLKEEVNNDKKFIEQTERALKEKKESWKVRSTLREGELAAISKAISILHSDDSRDLFKRSFASQGFLQLKQTTQKAQQFAKAADALRNAASRSGDRRLLSLASLAADPPGCAGESCKEMFGPVLKAIDDMIEQLQGEEKTDLKIKQTCEEDRMADTRDAVLESREIDEQTDKIRKLAAFIEKCIQEIDDLAKEKAGLEADLKKATEMREDEHKAWQKTDADDEAAGKVVLNAKSVLEGFYKDNFNFLQKSKQPVTGMAAGEAPPPPPATWDGDYGGKQGESTGIVSIMEMVYEDIKKDQKDAEDDENASEKEFLAFKKDTEDKLKANKKRSEKTDADKGTAEDDKVATEKLRTTNKQDLDNVLDKIRDANPNCEYFEVNYVLRTKNRQIEIDGLNKAKAILNGGQFASAAFLQRRK